MSKQLKDYYRVLGVSSSAEMAAIEVSYRRLARQFHPDLNPSSEAIERMLEINEAYEVLSNPSKRAQYDIEYGRVTEAPRADTRDASRQSQREASWIEKRLRQQERLEEEERRRREARLREEERLREAERLRRERMIQAQLRKEQRKG